MLYARQTRYNSWVVFRQALQPWTLPASALSFFLGTSLAWKYNQTFHPLTSGLTASVLLFMHAAGNFVNSFYEAQNRRFYATPATRRQVLHQITRLTIWSYFLALLSFVCLTVLSEANFKQEIGLFALGFLGSILHGTGLKNIVLGDAMACVIFGPLSVFFTYLEQVGAGNGRLSIMEIMSFSLPFVFYTEAIFHSQNTRDLEADRKAGYKTLAVLVGSQYACAVHSFLLLFPYVLLILMAPKYSLWFLLAAATLPFALILSVDCFKAELRCSLPMKTALLYTVFGILYVLSVL